MREIRLDPDREASETREPRGRHRCHPHATHCTARGRWVRSGWDKHPKPVTAPRNLSLRVEAADSPVSTALQAAFFADITSRYPEWSPAALSASMRPTSRPRRGLGRRVPQRSPGRRRWSAGVWIHDRRGPSDLPGRGGPRPRDRTRSSGRARRARPPDRLRAGAADEGRRAARGARTVPERRLPGDPAVHGRSLHATLDGEGAPLSDAGQAGRCAASQ